MNLLTQEIQASILFYHSNQEQFRQSYGGRYLLLRDTTVLGDFSSCGEAYQQGYRLLEHENFFVKYCR